ncbi:HAD-IIIA family hydrolase [Flexivirga sp. ID2601S]|uniref:D,D-heptose 1,7-bisphosphate phosphatase n=1 Tax=Flexivirga aerilata TaxID=1656889 RepID=A0A849AL96_9MICO|nr:HAD-IIIA family hydrolase [Flexivirga aerilata]NNG41175.1 HAD-IIIA family hydrolase [Flexivirga aerilata]
MPGELTTAELLGEETAPIGRPAPGAPFDVVFLDRDGTLNVHRPGYIADPAALELLPGAAEAVRRCNAAGCAVVLVTNQRGMATGQLSRAQLLAVHRALAERLGAAGAHLDAIQVCPHQTGTCDCRKPLPGLLLRAFARAGWARPARCVLIGDQPGDLEAAAAAGVPSYRVGPEVPLLDVVRHIVSGSQRTV